LPALPQHVATGLGGLVVHHIISACAAVSTLCIGVSAWTLTAMNCLPGCNFMHVQHALAFLDSLMTGTRHWTYHAVDVSCETKALLYCETCKHFIMLRRPNWPPLVFIEPLPVGLSEQLEVNWQHACVVCSHLCSRAATKVSGSNDSNNCSPFVTLMVVTVEWLQPGRRPSQEHRQN